MLNPTFTGPFKKDRKLMKKRNRNMDKLTEIEVFFNPVGDAAIKVFHAMPCRDNVLAQMRR
jgi:hypothetical protein